MEEVDKIILHSLRQIGCDIDHDINSLKEFNAVDIVKAAVSCLKLIQPGLDLPMYLPQNMAAKYRVGQMIAQACSDNGYPGDIGYQTFLYSGEADLRKVLMFLIEKLPKEQEKFVHEPSGYEIFLKKVKNKVKKELNCSKLPVHCNYNKFSKEFLSLMYPEQSLTSAWNEFCYKDLPLNSSVKKNLVPTLITLQSIGILNKNQIQWSGVIKTQDLCEKLYQEPKQKKFKPPIAPRPKTKVEVDQKKEEEKEKEKEKLKAEEEVLTEEVEKLVENIAQLKFKKIQIEQELEKNEELLRDRREKDVVRAKVVEMVPNGESNVRKLEEIVETVVQRLLSLSLQWEKHRLPLIAKYRNAVQLQSSRMDENVKKAETAKSLSEKRKELEMELKSKDQIISQLQCENEKNGKEVNRSAYTRRILEIINNIEKQKAEIEKVLKDTRDIQKEINILSGQLDRSFTVADETIFRDAKKDETSRKAYKLLATLHAECNQLVAMVQETGTIMREIRDFEDQIEKEKSKNISGNLERISADLNQMKVESAQLSTQLKLKQKS